MVAVVVVVVVGSKWRKNPSLESMMVVKTTAGAAAWLLPSPPPPPSPPPLQRQQSWRRGGICWEGAGERRVPHYCPQSRQHPGRCTPPRPSHYLLCGLNEHSDKELLGKQKERAGGRGLRLEVIGGGRDRMLGRGRGRGRGRRLCGGVLVLLGVLSGMTGREGMLGRSHAFAGHVHDGWKANNS